MDIIRNWKKILTIFVSTTLFITAISAFDILTKKKHPLSKEVRYGDLIVEKAVKHSVEPALVAAIIHAESNFNPNARSFAKAKGLMQINPITQRHLGLKDPFDPGQNVDAGTKYLSFLLKKFDGNLKHAIAAYNAGPGAVSKYKGIPPYRETRKYVKKVMKYYNDYRGTGAVLEAKISWIDSGDANQDA